MKKFYLLSMLTALFSFMGLSTAFADSGDSADDPLSINAGTSSWTWGGSNVWFKTTVPAGRTLVTTPSEGTIQADIYDCYDDVASESYTTKTFSETTPLKYVNEGTEDATIYVKVKNVLNTTATDISFSSWFDFVTPPTNTTWQTATTIEAGTLTLPSLTSNNTPMWYKLVVPAGTKVTLQKNYPHSCLLYAGDANAEAGTYVSGLFMYGNTKATWTNSASESVNLYICFSSTSGIAPYTLTVSMEAATPEAGSSWDYPIALVEGANNVKAIGNDANPMWYSCKLAAHTKVTFTNNYWPILASFYVGDDAAKADAEPAGSNFAAQATQTIENNTNAEETIYMKVVYSIGYGPNANVSVAYEELPIPASADAVVGDYSGTYSLVSASSGYPMGKTGEAENQTLTVVKNSDSSVDITLPAATLGELGFASYTVYNVAVDADGNLSGGSLAEGASYASFSAWGSAYTFDVTGTLDGANKTADVTINIHASVMPGAVADMVMTFKTPVVTPADKVAGEYTGTYSLDSAEGGAPAGYTGSMDGDVKMTVAKVSDTTVDITLPAGTISQMPYLSYTVKNVAVAADGTLSGGDLGGESYVNIGMGWGSASAFSVSGTLDGTNADVTINITASTVAGPSSMVMSFKTATVEPTADKVVGDYTGDYTLVSASAGYPAGKTGTLDNKVMTVAKSTDTTVDITLPLASGLAGVPFYSYTIKNVAVAADGTISGGDLGGASYTQIAPWGSATAFCVAGSLDGTNANVTINITANAMGTASDIVMTFMSGIFTSINQVASQKQNGEMYNLNGVRVNNNYKGVVIMNGKKYLNK